MNEISDADIAIFESVKTGNISLEQFKDWLKQRLAASCDEARECGIFEGWAEGYDVGYFRGFEDGRGG